SGELSTLVVPAGKGTDALREVLVGQASVSHSQANPARAADARCSRLALIRFEASQELDEDTERSIRQSGGVPGRPVDDLSRIERANLPPHGPTRLLIFMRSVGVETGTFVPGCDMNVVYSIDTGLAYSPDEQILAHSISRDIYLWDFESKVLKKLEG